MNFAKAGVRNSILWPDPGELKDRTKVPLAHSLLCFKWADPIQSTDAVNNCVTAALLVAASAPKLLQFSVKPKFSDAITLTEVIGLFDATIDSL
jgi:hypothetical protein